MKKVMWKPYRSTLVRCLLPIVAVVIAIMLQVILTHLLPKHAQFPYAFFYLIGVFAVAWYAGYVPGVVTTVLVMVVLPDLVAHKIDLSKFDSKLYMMLALSVLISKVAAGQQHLREVLQEANDDLEDRVNQRTSELGEVVESLRVEVEHREQAEVRLQTQLGRLSLLDQITRLIGDRQDLRSVFQVVIRTLEDSLPIDFGCVCLYEPADETLTVTCVGVRSAPLAMELALTEQSRIVIDQNGLSLCVRGQLVYEPDVLDVKFPFPTRLSKSGLRSVVFAPLLSESSVFGVLVVARRTANDFSSTDCEFLRQLSEHVALASVQAQTLGALQQAYDDLRRSQQAVMEQERLRALGQMASGIAHDINNALSPVALYMESLLEREPNLSARTRQYLETTQRAVEDVSHTVGRMREFYRQPESQISQGEVDLNRMVEQVADLTRARWNDIPQRQGIVIQMCRELAPDLPRIGGIESEIREALTNLILNAVDAMPEGGTLTVRTRSATASGDSVPRVLLEVRDTGIGMDEETRRRCLEPFFTTKGQRGTGLGLAMVYGVAQRHNANIEMESAVGAGTTVRLDFPKAVRKAVTGESTVRSAAFVSRLRILVVDDDPLVIHSLSEILQTEGHTVTAAPGGREGIEVIRQTPEGTEPFDLVITDLGMPYVDGRKIASAVKLAWKSTPVILLTGWGQRMVDENEMPPYVDRILNKPPRLNQLRAALSELTSMPRAA
jgi:signal transduction histidine kinase/ActR/RegA family two-component response regulator